MAACCDSYVAPSPAASYLSSHLDCSFPNVVVVASWTFHPLRRTYQRHPRHHHSVVVVVDIAALLAVAVEIVAYLTHQTIFVVAVVVVVDDGHYHHHQYDYCWHYRYHHVGALAY